MKDYLTRCDDLSGQVRGFAIMSTNLVEEERKMHNLSPIATQALGRSLSAVLMMGAMLKNENETVSLQFRGNGPLRSIVVLANGALKARGYVGNPGVVLMPKEDGRIHVGEALGEGTLTYVRDMKMKEPYVSTIPLVTGEVAEDLTAFFANSEQTPSSVGLGVLMNREDGSVKVAGGFIIQLLPGCSQEAIERIEKNLTSLGSVTDILDKEDAEAEHLLGKVLDGFQLMFYGRDEVSLYCTCSDERNLGIIESLSVGELEDIVNGGKEVEIDCAFCGKHYAYPLDQIQAILDRKEAARKAKKAAKKA